MNEKKNTNYWLFGTPASCIASWKDFGAVILIVLFSDAASLNFMGEGADYPECTISSSKVTNT